MQCKGGPCSRYPNRPNLFHEVRAHAATTRSWVMHFCRAPRAKYPGGGTCLQMLVFPPLGSQQSHAKMAVETSPESLLATFFPVGKSGAAFAKAALILSLPVLAKARHFCFQIIFTCFDREFRSSGAESRKGLAGEGKLLRFRAGARNRIEPAPHNLRRCKKQQYMMPHVESLFPACIRSGCMRDSSSLGCAGQVASELSQGMHAAMRQTNVLYLTSAGLCFLCMGSHHLWLYICCSTIRFCVVWVGALLFASSMPGTGNKISSSLNLVTTCRLTSGDPETPQTVTFVPFLSVCMHGQRLAPDILHQA